MPKKANTVLIKIQISNCAYTLISHTTCICKSSEHLALDCPHSWYRRPQKIDPENDLVVENILAEVNPESHPGDASEDCPGDDPPPSGDPPGCVVAGPRIWCLCCR